MKILQINAVGQYGSTGRTCREISEYINQETEDICYTAFSEGVADKYSYRIGTSLEKKIHALLSRVSGKQAHFSRRGTRELLRYMDEIKPDVVHLHNLHGNYIHLPQLLRYLASNDIPTVLTLHDCWFYTGKCCHYTADECYKWKTGCHHCPRLKKDNASWFRDATPQLWGEKKKLFEAIPRLAVVGVSDWITNEAGKSFLACAKEIRRIYNWIDLEVFCPRENSFAIRTLMGITGKKVVLGVASGWSDAKGLGEFIRLAGLLGDDYAVVLVGHMPDGFGLPSRIYHIPATESPDELAEYYSMADVFVTLSLEESFGKVSAEALACGTPVICYDSTANGELVGEGCGKVISPGNLGETAAAVKEICAAEKQLFTVRCRAFAGMNFSKAVRINDYMELYRIMMTCQ